MEPILHTPHTPAQNRSAVKTTLCVLLLLLGLFVFQQAVSILSGRVADALPKPSFDPDGTFWWISVHHLAQLLASLAFILLHQKVLRISFHIQWKLDRSGVKMLALFVGCMLVYACLYYAIGHRLGMLIPYRYPSTFGNIAGTLGFQLLLSGPSEELLFRAIPITLLLRLFRDSRPRSRAFCIVVASLLFSLAHVSWYTNPFRLEYHWYQLLYAFALGIVYGLSYTKRQSVLYPMLLHSISNVIVIGLGYVIFPML